MSRFRLRLLHGTDAVEFTDWEDEHLTHRQQGGLTAAGRVQELRRKYPDAAISIEREGRTPIPTPELFRFNVHVRSGKVLVIDEDGTHERNLTNAHLQSRPFQASERESVIAGIRAQFPDANISEVRIKGGLR